ncbi:MAG: hypothetical protein Q9187_007254, partial [Circinaria calcarea]
MKYAAILTASLATAASALSIIRSDQSVLNNSPDVEKYLIELGPGNIRWVTEEEKWELRR